MVKYIYCLYENKYFYSEIETKFLGYYHKFEDLIEKLQEFDYNQIPKKGILKDSCGYFYEKFEIVKNTKYFASIFQDIIILDIKPIIEINNHSLQMFGLKNLQKYSNFTLQLIDYDKLITIDEKYYSLEKVSLINKNELLTIYPEYKDFIEMNNVTFYLENDKSISDTIIDKLLISLDERHNIFRLLSKSDCEIYYKNMKIKDEKILHDKKEQFKKELDEYVINITDCCDQFKSDLIKLDEIQCTHILYKLRDAINFFQGFKMNLKK